jgi:hypothetical protein
MLTLEVEQMCAETVPLCENSRRDAGAGQR